MDRTERLFSIIDELRQRRHPVTAAELAQAQGVSVRTLYRDIQALIGLGAPIDGAAGLGYVLRPGFFLPPMSFDADELEALVLGARWVEGRPDGELAAAARRALGKIAAAADADLRDRMADTGLWPVRHGPPSLDTPVLGLLRGAMRREKAVRLAYEDEAGRASERLIWPIQLAYYDEKQIVAAWCTLRDDFRSFRIDRIRTAEETAERYGRRRAALARDWRDRFEDDGFKSHRPI